MPKQSNPPRPKKGRSSPPQPPPFSRLEMDQTLTNLQKLLAGQEFQSIDEVNAFLQRTLQAHGGRLPESEPETPLERAQALVLRATQLTSARRQRQLARQALDLSPDCADAYSLLAQLEPVPTRKLVWLEQAVAAGERALGADRLKELEGHFWGAVETRPLMRAYAGLAELSWVLGDRGRATSLYHHMLRLNPQDNQGVRYMLAICLLEERTAEAQSTLQELLNRFPEDAAAHWAYNRALLSFQLKQQTTDMADQVLADAMRANPHVPPLLLGEKPMPQELPQAIGFGDIDEAIDYVAFALNAWRHTSGALPWLRTRCPR